MDDILSAYEDLWRKAALEDHRQFSGRDLKRGSTGLLDCAWTIGKQPLMEQANNTLAVWTCNECNADSRVLASVMIHVNNVHGWDWLTLANKFRFTLENGIAHEVRSPKEEI